MTTAALEKAQLRIEEHYLQVQDDDGNRRFVRSGWVIAGLVDGTHRFEYQSVFSDMEAAERRINDLCGVLSNGYSAMIDTSSGMNPNVSGFDWQYTGSSR